jgi:uncharacterized membrane protein YhaH (DUF805 family)
MSLGQLYFSAKGRISRSTFWLKGVLPIAAIITLGVVIDVIVYGEDWFLSALLVLLLIWPALALQIKRLHDRNKSGWWVLIGLIPLVGQVLMTIECGFGPGTAGDNRYGKEPMKRRTAAVADTQPAARLQTTRPAGTGAGKTTMPRMPANGEKSVSEDLGRLRVHIAALPERYPFAGVSFGAGAAQAAEQVPIICRNIDQAITALETGRDPNGNPITPELVGSGLQRLVVATRKPAFEALMITVLSPVGIQQLQGALVDLEHIAQRLSTQQPGRDQPVAGRPAPAQDESGEQDRAEWLRTAQALGKEGEHEASIEYLDRTITAGLDTNGYARYLKGCALLELGRPEEAAEWLQGALEVDPTLEDGRLALGRVLYELGRYDEARSAFRTLAGHTYLYGIDKKAREWLQRMNEEGH